MPVELFVGVGCVTFFVGWLVYEYGCLLRLRYALRPDRGTTSPFLIFGPVMCLCLGRLMLIAGPVVVIGSVIQEWGL